SIKTMIRNEIIDKDGLRCSEQTLGLACLSAAWSWPWFVRQVRRRDQTGKKERSDRNHHVHTEPGTFSGDLVSCCGFLGGSLLPLTSLVQGLLVWCGAAEGGFSDKLVELGQNVTLDCEVSVKNVYWYLMKPMEPPVFILLSHSSVSTFATYENPTLNRTFSLQLNSSLFIANVTENELGIYYCALNGMPPKFSTGTRLQPTSGPPSDHQEENQELQNHKEQTGLLPTVLIISALQICVLVIAVAGSVFSTYINSVAVSHCTASPKSRLPTSVQQHSGMQQNRVSVLFQEGLQTGHRRSSYTVVEFTQFSSDLQDQ
ncbi:hypothetical protein NFI96_005347, partial [Prochilodus magdalenae]